MSSPPPSELSPETVRAGLADWLRLNAVGVERIGGGRNSQVYKLTVDLPVQAPAFTQASSLLSSLASGAAGARSNRACLALKAYFRHPNDQRDRLATEYNSFSYLWAKGFREIPQPIDIEPRLGWAIYQFIAGERIPPGVATESEVLAAVDLLGRLRHLSRDPESLKLGIASEACFAPRLIIENLQHRLERVRSVLSAECGMRNAECDVRSEEPAHSAIRTPHSALEALRTFLADEFIPFFEEVVPWSEAHLKAAGQSFTDELELDRRTLSPSDFGFHNALRRPDGRIIFLDFEYFGWDDPAKMIVDFLLHPAMALSPPLKRTFAAESFRRFADWPGLRERVESVYPLFGLKWCLIFLNEFLPDAYLRRQFAATAHADRAALQLEQLAKARGMLQRIRQEYQSFPYRD